MITSIVEISETRLERLLPDRFRSVSFYRSVLALLAFLVVCTQTLATPLPGPWAPLYKGIQHASGTNNPNIAGNFGTWQVVRCVKVDLQDPDVRLFSTPPAPGYIAESRETLTQTVPNFLRQNGLQIACDANYYSASNGGSDPPGEGISCEVFGLQICTGIVVSAQTSADASGNPRYASLLFSTNNQPFFDFVNRPPGTNVSGIYTAITGYYPIVSNGVNIGAAAANSYPDGVIHQDQPRTAIGVSQDNRYLLILTIDGRQSNYSDGALDAETAYWMLQFGAYNAINMDGGGSTALYMADSAGNPIGMNHSSYLAAYGHERYVGSHFGVYAKLLPGFINEVSAIADDTAATVTFNTTNLGTSLVQYGLTPNLGLASAYSADMVTNHSVLLTGLAPGTQYFYRAFSSDGANQYSSAIFSFTTTNYATTNLIFDLTNSWTFGTANLDGVNWTAPGYDDSGWVGSGPGLLWVDTVHGSPDPNIPVPALTQMPGNPSTGYPYPTYYFRTHFTFTNNVPGVGLAVTDYLDDGAVFYLNGTEIYRLRTPPSPTQIVNSTRASGYACSNSVDFGNAVCPDFWSIGGDLATNLVSGDNVLAVEVHNYSPGSADITFGLALSYTTPYAAPPQLTIQQSDSNLTISWNRGGFTLQQAGSPAGPWSNVPGPVVSSPFITPNSGSATYFRLSK